MNCSDVCLPGDWDGYCRGISASTGYSCGVSVTAPHDGAAYMRRNSSLYCYQHANHSPAGEPTHFGGKTKMDLDLAAKIKSMQQ